MFFSVIISSPKKYHVRGMNTIYPNPKVMKRIDQRDTSAPYISFVPYANDKATIGPHNKAVYT